MIFYSHFESPLGRMVLAAGFSGLKGIWFEGQRHFAGVAAAWRPDNNDHLRACARQLEEYFAGRRQSFELALDPDGTVFQRAIWEQIARIAYGQTRSYGAIAQAVGKPTGSRAAGAATGRNPLSIIIPCHRVIATDGSLTDYAGGLSRKRALLELEGRM